MSEHDADDIARDDEMLELLYWLEGEGFREETTTSAMARLLDQSPADVQDTLARLVGHGCVQQTDGDGRWELTSGGRVEASRRFLAEFAPLMHQGHGECHDPDCDCHEEPGHAVHCTGRGQG